MWQIFLQLKILRQIFLQQKCLWQTFQIQFNTFKTGIFQYSSFHLSSISHKEFHSKLKVSFLKALDILQKNFDSEFGVNKSKNTECIEPYSSQEDISDEEGSCATSFNQVILIYPSIFFFFFFWLLMDIVRA